MSGMRAGRRCGRYNCTVKLLVRITYNVTLIVSVLLSFALAALWISSYWLNFRIERDGEPDFSKQLVASHGYIAYIMYHHGAADPAWPRATIQIGTGDTFETRSYDEDWTNLSAGRPDWHGFAYEDFDFDDFYNHVSGRMAMIPLWLPFAVFAVAPGIVLIGRVRRARRKQNGRCPNCGYDLRATPQRCPECGRVPSKAGY
jgi:hypothetical protein